MLANGQFFSQQPAAAAAVEVIPIKALFSHSSHCKKIKASYIQQKLDLSRGNLFLT
jgi:hypothetical protein